MPGVGNEQREEARLSGTAKLIKSCPRLWPPSTQGALSAECNRVSLPPHPACTATSTSLLFKKLSPRELYPGLRGDLNEKEIHERGRYV